MADVIVTLALNSAALADKLATALTEIAEQMRSSNTRPHERQESSHA